MVTQEELAKIYKAPKKASATYDGRRPATADEIKAAKNGNGSYRPATPKQIVETRTQASDDFTNKEDFFRLVTEISLDIYPFSIALCDDLLNQIFYFIERFLDEDGQFREQSIRHFLTWLDAFVWENKKNGITPIEVLRAMFPKDIRKKGDVNTKRTNRIRQGLVEAKKNGK